MYKIASENAQRRRERLDLAAIVKAGVPEHYTPEQQYESLKAHIFSLEELIAKANTPREQAWLGKHKFDVQSKMAELRKLIKQRNVLRTAAQKTLADRFIVVAKRVLPPETYDEIRAQAWAEYERATAAAARLDKAS